MHVTVQDEMLSAVGFIAVAIEVIAVAIIGIAVLYGTIFFIVRRSSEAGYDQYKHTLGKGLLLGLEILVAARHYSHGRIGADNSKHIWTRVIGAHSHISQLVIGGRDRRALALAA